MLKCINKEDIFRENASKLERCLVLLKCTLKFNKIAHRLVFKFFLTFFYEKLFLSGIIS